MISFLDFVTDNYLQLCAMYVLGCGLAWIVLSVNTFRVGGLTFWRLPLGARSIGGCVYVTRKRHNSTVRL